MGRVCVVNFVSMDGVIQAPLSADEDREQGFTGGGWVPPFSDETVDAFMEDSTVNAAGMLLGRRTYDTMRVAWAGADQSVPAIAAMNRMPKYVVTTSDDLAWQNSHRMTGDLLTAVASLTSQTEGDLVVFGSGALVRSLAALDLVDEYRLLLFPVILGAGKRMFDERAQPARFTVSDTTLAPSGVAILTYTRAPA